MVSIGEVVTSGLSNLAELVNPPRLFLSVTGLSPLGLVIGFFLGGIADLSFIMFVDCVRSHFTHLTLLLDAAWCAVTLPHVGQYSLISGSNYRRLADPLAWVGLDYHRGIYQRTA